MPALASPAIGVARDDADGHGEEEGQGGGERGEDQEQAVVGDLRDERRAATAAATGRAEPSPVSILHGEAHEDRHGRRARPSRARVRQRRKVVSSSLRNSPSVHSGLGAAGRGHLGPGRRRPQPATSKPSPRQRHERVLKGRRPFHARSPATRTPGRDQRGVQVGEVARSGQLRRSTRSPSATTTGDALLLQHPGRVARVGRGHHQAPARPRRQVGDRRPG